MADYDSDASSEPESHLNMFADPPDYYPPTPPPTTQTYTTQSGQAITLHLVGYSPTEAHHLWNGSRVISEHFEAHPHEVAGRTVLELGAGAGLPSLVAAALGARKVVVTDYPDPDIVETMARNVDECALVPRGGPPPEVVTPLGFVWGADPRPLLAELPPGGAGGGGGGGGGGEEGGKEEPGFDVLILADLLFRHSEHGHMLDTVRDTLKKGGGSKAFVFFTSYRPWLQHKDLSFFDLARERGFVVDKILEKKMERAMFENDPGDEEVRKTCSGWTVRWPTGEEIRGQVTE